MSKIYKKEFPDSAGGEYAQSREYQFLDLLNQLGASVPQVNSNNTRERCIEMAHVGTDLRDWLLVRPNSIIGQSQALDAINKALKIVEELAQLNIWHLDLALRNFVVDQADNVNHAKVSLIDFSLSVSKRFPLEKPLFMLPDEGQQHPILFSAVMQDWQQFFKRNNIKEPTKYDLQLEIPMGIYKADWSSDLSVDNLSHPWCVIAHSVGKMLIQCTKMQCIEEKSQVELLKLAQNLQSLSSESEAQSRFQEMRDWLTNKLSDTTPRPKAAQAIQATIPSSPLSATSTATLNKRFDDHPVDAPSASLKIKTSATNSELNSESSSQLSLLKISLGIITFALGYLLTDAIYVAFNIAVTNYTTSIAAVLIFLLLSLLIVLLFSKNKPLICKRMMQLQGIALIGFSVEIWINFVPLQWPLLVLGIGVTSMFINPRK